MNWVVTCSQCGSFYVYASGQGLPEICSKCVDRGKKDVKVFLEKEKRRKETVMATSRSGSSRMKPSNWVEMQLSGWMSLIESWGMYHDMIMMLVGAQGTAVVAE